MTVPMTAEQCRKKLTELEDLRRIVSFAPDKERLGEQCDAMERECLRLEKAEDEGAGAIPGA